MDSKELAAQHGEETYQDDYNGAPPPRPEGWMYKSFSPFGKRLEMWYASPKFQLILISMVCFLCPGMFNALGGLGGGGLDQQHQWVGANTNVALYSTFAVFGFFAGTITNRLGIRIALAFGGLGYCIYAAAFLCFKHTFNIGFVYFSGAFLGACAGILWCAQGAIMMSYPREASKGRYISVFWIIFNLGGSIGSMASPVKTTSCKQCSNLSNRFRWLRPLITKLPPQLRTASMPLSLFSWPWVPPSRSLCAMPTRLFVKMVAKSS